jgi:GNAT superfamily N-acetyltransferase
MPDLRVDANLFEFYACAAAAAKMPLVRRDAYSYLDMSPSPWANTVFDLDFSGTEGVPPSLREGILAGSIPNKVRVGPSSRPRDIERHLTEAGFAVRGTMRGMILDRKECVVLPAPIDLSLDLLSTTEEFLDFSGLVSLSLFQDRGGSVRAFAEMLASLGRERCFGFLGRAEGAPASAAFVFMGKDGQGGLYFVATRSSLRGRGYGTATVCAALAELWRRGARSCILQATDLGLPIYRRLGFEDSCRLVQYHLPG